MRSIIVEGMDGSGKSTLIKDLLGAFPTHRMHERASTSLGGPVNNLGEWVARDAVRMSETGPWLYDRHPLVSEPIYGKYRPGRPTTPPFDNLAWLDAYRRQVSRDSVLVLCDPGFEAVRNNLTASGPDAHMPGVFSHAFKIWCDYSLFQWPGRTIRYNYTKDTVDDLVLSLRKMGNE